MSIERRVKINLLGNTRLPPASGTRAWGKGRGHGQLWGSLGILCTRAVAVAVWFGVSTTSTSTKDASLSLSISERAAPFAGLALSPTGKEPSRKLPGKVSLSRI